MNKIIDDLHCEFYGNLNKIIYVVEFDNGTEKEIGEYLVDKTPQFADEKTPLENSDYEYFYNLGLQLAHEKGYVLKGETK